MAGKKYTSGKPVRLNPISFEMIEEKVKHIRPGRKITIWVPKKKTNEDKEEFRVVKGTVVKVYDNMVYVRVKATKRNSYNECFLKVDLYNWRFDVR